MADNLQSVMAPGVTTEFSAGNLVNTINPFAYSDNYTPAWLIKAFESSKDKKGLAQGTPSKLANITAKVAAGALTFGIGAWLVRSLMHSMNLDRLSQQGLGGANASAGAKLDTIYKRPVENPFDAKQEKQDQNQEQYGPEEQIEKQASLDKQAVEGFQLARGIVPLAAVVLATAGAFKAADTHYDRKLSKRLDEDLEKQLQTRAQIGERRILAARGVSRRKKLAPQATLQKQAGYGEILGVGALLLATAAGLAAFNMSKQNDKDTVDYQAYKKGLQEYNKLRASEEITSSRPIDQKKIRLFNKNIDKKEKNPRQQQDVSDVNTYRDLLV